MTDNEALFSFRLKEAEETLAEAERMLRENFSSRTIVNRAYYSMFYAVLSLFLKTGVNIKTSKHAGIISIFDLEFVKPGKIDRRYSTILHDTFDLRREGDYKDMVNIPHEKAELSVANAQKFLDAIKQIIS